MWVRRVWVLGIGREGMVKDGVGKEAMSREGMGKEGVDGREAVEGEDVCHYPCLLLTHSPPLFPK